MTVTFLFVVALVDIVARSALGPLPSGAELVAWAYAGASVVTVLLLGTWSRRTSQARSFSSSVAAAYVLMGIAGSASLAVWIFLFYGSGSYEKGGYTRLAGGLLTLLALMSSGAVVAARVIARAALRDAAAVLLLVALMLLTFLAGMVVIPIIAH